jgi:endonuclease/exonuclease/phosphatase (EEP) superfamily protein YafD
LAQHARSSAHQPDDATLTVMTFNIGNGMAPPDMLVELLRETPADVVALQEVAPEQAAAIADQLRDVYPEQVLHPTGFSGKGLLSTHPVVDHERLHLVHERPDLRAVLDIAGTSLEVVVGHPRPPQIKPTGVVFDPRTLAQIDGLLATTVGSERAILLGDFNMSTRNAAYRRLVGAGLTDAFRASGRGRAATFPTRLGYSEKVPFRVWKRPLRPVARLDYIFHTARLASLDAWVGDDAGSDHLPVLARLRLLP